MVLLWLKFDKEEQKSSAGIKDEVSLMESAREMMNPAVANLLATVLCFGVLSGVRISQNTQ